MAMTLEQLQDKYPDDAVTARLRFILIILPAVQRTAAGYFLTGNDQRRQGNPESRIF
jgi:hypothetical protein